MIDLSELIGFILLPSNLIALVGALGLVALLLRRLRVGLGFLIGGALILMACGWSPIGLAALTVLENRFPSPNLTEPIAGIVMLGGGVDTHVTVDRGQSTLNEAGERITAVGVLSREFPQARILLSGGAGHDLTGHTITESAVARDVLIALGLEPQRIEMEERSVDTCENAAESLLAARPAAREQWLLVTSASHMPRAVACFRAVGFSVIPYPVDYRTRGAANLGAPISIAEGLRATDLAAHEWLGLLGYRLMGRTSELFPGP